MSTENKQQEIAKPDTTPVYEFTYKMTAQDWWYHMTVIYTSLAGIVNIIFTAAMIALMVARFGHTNIVFKIIMIIAVLIFPFFQPVAIMGKSVNEAAKDVPDTTLTFDDRGMTIRVLKHYQRINYPKMNDIIKEKTLVYVMPDETHAYILTNRILGEQKDDFYHFVRERLIQAQPDKMNRREKKERGLK